VNRLFLTGYDAHMPIRIAAVVFAATVALVLGACASPPPIDLTIDPTAAYDGPPVNTTVVKGYHALSVVVPTGGWRMVDEHLERRFRDNRVFLTLRRPDPELMHTQAMAQFDVSPGVRADVPLAVYVRVIDFGAEPNDERFVLAEAIAPVRH